MNLEARLRRLYAYDLLNFPFPGKGETALRHRKLAEIARQDLALARLAEAHVDAVAILAEAGRKPHAGLYGVWAAETRGYPLFIKTSPDGSTLNGSKMFCSGAGLIDRALVTVCRPEPRLVDVSLRSSPETIAFDQTAWKVTAFADTQTATAHFAETPISEEDLIGGPNWYLVRPGFWHGACGPASCWAGGAMGLVDYALAQSRDDAQTMAHLGAMSAGVWGLSAYLDLAGREVDQKPNDVDAAMTRALSVRHLIDQACNDILMRLGRAYGPRALAFDPFVSKRYQELEIYIRQCHAERDLEALGRRIFSSGEHHTAAVITPGPTP
jgi:hypothetical protein